MIAFLYAGDPRPLGSTLRDLEARFIKLADPHGRLPEIVIVADPDDMPRDSCDASGRFMALETLSLVDPKTCRNWTDAVRTGFNSTTGSAVMFFDSPDQLTEAVYKSLVPGCMYPLTDCAGSCLTVDPARLRKATTDTMFLLPYEGPLRAPFSLRRSAMLAAGGPPATPGGSVDAMLFAWTVQMRTAGYWVAGVAR